MICFEERIETTKISKPLCVYLKKNMLLVD